MIYTTAVSLIPNLFHVVQMNSKRNLTGEDGRCIFFCKLNASGYLNSLPLVSRSLIEWEVRLKALRKSEDNGRDINTGYSARKDKDCEVRKLISVYANISRRQTASRISVIKFLEKKNLRSTARAAFLLRKQNY